MDIKLYKDNVIKGIRVGLVAFLICFVVVGVFSSLINYIYLDDINKLLNGSLSQEPVPGLSTLLLIISIILNLTVFNNGGVLENGGSMHIGLLILIVLPVVAFFIADRNSNKTKHFNIHDMIEYLTSSIIFSIVLFVFSLIAKGSLLGLDVNYTNPRNVLMTIVILMCVQVFIGLNYDKNFTEGVDKTRLVLRILLGIGLIAGGMGMLLVFGKYLGSLMVTLLATIILLPNIAVYIMFMFMGASVEFGDQLHTLMSRFNVDLSFTVLPLPIRLCMILLFFGLIFLNIWKMKEEEYFKHLALFGISFSMISFVFAYMTKMNLGFIKNMLDVQFGINYLFSFLMPLLVVFLAGALVWLIRYVVKTSKEDF